jgi:hypothetical protein
MAPILGGAITHLARAYFQLTRKPIDRRQPLAIACVAMLSGADYYMDGWKSSMTFGRLTSSRNQLIHRGSIESPEPRHFGISPPGSAGKDRRHV